jgi:hypothetical protein
MSARTLICAALVNALKTQINGVAPYTTNLFSNALDSLKYWDELNDFPFICAVAGNEVREYLPGQFKWGHLGISLKVYVRSETSGADLENLMEDIERVVDSNRQIAYDPANPSRRTTEVLITSIITDEGLLAPYGIGEINIKVQYQVLI